MVRVRWNRRESSVGLGPNQVRGCCCGLTNRNQVEESTEQSPSSDVKGLDLLVNWDSGWPSGCSYATETSHGSRCMCESVLACVDARLGAPWCGPPPRKAEQPSLRGGDGAGAVEPEGI